MRVSLFLVGIAEYDDPDEHNAFADNPVELECILNGDDILSDNPVMFKIDYVKSVPVDYPDPQDEDEGDPEHDLWRERAEQEALKVMVGPTSSIADMIKDRT